MSGKLRPGDRAPSVELYRTSGSVVDIAELWSNAPVVITFLRHFGWPFCRDLLAQLRREHARIIESGAGIAAVGMGEPAQVATFCAERELPFTCLADPDRRGYDAFGLAHGGPRELVGPKVLWRGLGVLRRGVSAGRPHSGQSARQMPGTFVVAADGTLRLAHYNADASDNPSMEQVLAALGL